MNPTSTTASERRQALRERLAGNQGGILEDLARTEGIPLLDVIRCLPESLWTRISGGYFTAVMSELAHWGDLTTVVHTPDLILEFKGPIPQGRLGHGFYNLIARQGLSGHLRPDHCTDIVFLQRPFMGLDTAAVQFFNASGECMFKVFLGRDTERRLRPDQLERFAALAARWREGDEMNP